MTQGQARTLAHSIVDRRNIVVVGSTGSGKTTLANALIAEIAAVHPCHRLVIIETHRKSSAPRPIA
jgi:type IV secretion system protein TrbB